MAKQPPSGDYFARHRSTAIKDVVTTNGFTLGGDAELLLHLKQPACIGKIIGSLSQCVDNESMCRSPKGRYAAAASAVNRRTTR